MQTRRIIIVGGGAAGFFAAIAAAESARDSEQNVEVWIVEKSAHFLSKVRISGGGRCNVTHSCFDARELSTRYPRGARALIAPFQRFQPSDTVAWFESRGVHLKTESDGRMFPTTDSSETIIDCLLESARRAGVQLFLKRGVERVERQDDRRFAVHFANEEVAECDALLLATGGARGSAGGALAASLGHEIHSPVPSLFTFHIETPWLRELAGVSVESAEVAAPGFGLRERGPLLATHWGLSGPAILRLSAWGARALHEVDYHFPLTVNWLPDLRAEMVVSELLQRRETQGARLVVNTPIAPLSARLWEALVLASGISRDARWSILPRDLQNNLVRQLTRSEFVVSGKSLNKDEFVTCGGVALKEVNFKTMESRVCAGLFFAGELLDVDGITGGFNFQAAWTTGWIAGNAMAEEVRAGELESR